MKQQYDYQRPVAIAAALALACVIGLAMWLHVSRAESVERVPTEPFIPRRAGVSCSSFSPARRALFDAIWQIESSRRLHPPDGARGEKGPYQISPAYWRDGCEFGRVHWDYHELVWSRPHCERVMELFWQRYGAQTDEERVRMFNGGPRGPARASTLAYWLRVMALMGEREPRQPN